MVDAQEESLCSPYPVNRGKIIAVYALRNRTRWIGDPREKRWIVRRNLALEAFLDP